MKLITCSKGIFPFGINDALIDEISPYPFALLMAGGRNDGRFTRKMGVFLRRLRRLKNTFSPSKMQKVISTKGRNLNLHAVTDNKVRNPEWQSFIYNTTSCNML